MASPERSKSQYYRPELDVLRFLAFLLVFLFHTMPRSSALPGISRSIKGFASVLDDFDHACGFGLSLFFTLSAFLICELLLRERETAGTVGVKQFYIRRILRIWPLYYLALTLCLAVAFLPGGPRGDVSRVGWFAVFLGAWYSASHFFPISPIAPLWSISVEEQFYLIVPWVLKYTSRNMLYAFCVGIILCANARLCYLSVAVAAGYDPWYDPIVQFECFAAGILLSISLRGRLPRFAVWHRVILIAASWICWVAANYLQDHHFRSFEIAGSIQQMCHYGLVAIGCVMMLMAFLGVSPKLLPGFLIYLGRISFGLYVYHEFAIFIVSRLLFPYASKLANPVLLLRISIELGLTILMAALSYRYFETPFLKMKRRHAVIRSQPIGTESTSQNV